MVLVIFNLVLIWFGAMGFFDYTPEGTEVNNPGGILGFSGLDLWGVSFLIAGITAIAAVISRLTGINLVKMVLYMNVFWFPYIATMGTFNKVFAGSPDVFLGFFTIFSIVMIFVFAYDLYEMSGLEFVN